MRYLVRLIKIAFFVSGAQPMAMREWGESVSVVEAKRAELPPCAPI